MTIAEQAIEAAVQEANGSQSHLLSSTVSRQVIQKQVLSKLQANNVLPAGTLALLRYYDLQREVDQVRDTTR